MSESDDYANAALAAPERVDSQSSAAWAVTGAGAAVFLTVVAQLGIAEAAGWVQLLAFLALLAWGTAMSAFLHALAPIRPKKRADGTVADSELTIVDRALEVAKMRAKRVRLAVTVSYVAIATSVVSIALTGMDSSKDKTPPVSQVVLTVEGEKLVRDMCDIGDFPLEVSDARWQNRTVTLRLSNAGELCRGMTLSIDDSMVLAGLSQ